MQEITAKQKLFADEFIKTGNATQSYVKVYNADVKIAEAASSRLLRNVKVKEYIDTINVKLEKETIADMTEVKEFWSNVLRNPEMKPMERLKASEYIAKTAGAFIEKSEVEFKTLPQIIIKRGGTGG